MPNCTCTSESPDTCIEVVGVVLPPPADPAPDLVIALKVLFFGLRLVGLCENDSEIMVTKFLQGF